MMKTFAPALLALVLAGPACAQHNHATHADHAAHEAHVNAAPAQRWTPDDPLRQGMARIHAAVHAMHQQQPLGSDPAAVREQVKAVQAAAAEIFAHCKLAPEADAALHDILVPLLAAANGLQKNPADQAAFDKLHATMLRYPQTFNDPDWHAGMQHEHEAAGEEHHGHAQGH